MSGSYGELVIAHEAAHAAAMRARGSAVVLSGQRAAPGQGPAQSKFVGEFQVAAHRQA